MTDIFDEPMVSLSYNTRLFFKNKSTAAKFVRDLRASFPELWPSIMTIGPGRYEAYYVLFVISGSLDVTETVRSFYQQHDT